MLVSRFPYPLEKGDKLRAFYQLKELSKHYDVTLFAVSRRAIKKEELEIVGQYCEEVIIHQQKLIHVAFNVARSVLNGKPFQVGYFYNTSAKRMLKSLLEKKSFNHIYCQLVRMTEYVKDYHDIGKTLDYQDAFSVGVERRINQQPLYKRWIFKMEARRLRMYETRMFDFFEVKTIISQQDRQLIYHPDAAKILCIPNGIDEQFFAAPSLQKDIDFVFVGNMSYAPNVEAVAYIDEHILPHFPTAKLLVSGSTPAPRVKKLAQQSKQIELTGWVDDIRHSYVRGKLFLAPMMIGTGMQNKLLEAMALGVPCITTSLANNAINGRHEQEILVAENPFEFIEQIKRIQSDEDLYKRLKEQAQLFVKNNYTWERATTELVDAMEKYS